MMDDRPPRFMDRSQVKVLETKRLYQGFLSLDHYVLQHVCFEGGWSKPLSRELLLRKHAVAVLLHDPHLGSVVLVEQFRVGALADEHSPWLLELVAGLIEEGESPEAVAIRESLEEAACQPESLELIHEFYLSPGATDEKLTLYHAYVRADGLGGIHGLESEGEDIRVHVMSYEEVFRLLDQGKINNAIAIIALQWLKQHLQGEVSKR